MHSDNLTGGDFEFWLMDPEFRAIPDFLAMNEIGDAINPMALLKQDIRPLRALANSRPGERVPTHFLAGLVRLHHHSVIGRIDTDRGAIFHMTPYSYEVLMHNVSFREAKHS